MIRMSMTWTCHMITIITTYFIGLTSNEKDRLFSFAKDKIKSIK